MTRKRSKTGLTTRKVRRVSLRANAKATQALWDEAEIGNSGKRDQRTVLKLASSRLDDVELETAWKAALRGDYTVASARLQRTVKQAPVRPRKRKPKGWSPWRNALLPRKRK